MAVTKTTYVQIRVDRTRKQLLERAAAESHMSLSDFLLESAVRHAAEVLAQRALIVLSPAVAAAFDEILNTPATVNDQLATAFTAKRTICWLD
jgi:uncharacterized protein (DUF1778 family)